MNITIFKDDFKKYPQFWERFLDYRKEDEELKDQIVSVTIEITDEELIIQLLTTEKDINKISEINFDVLES